MFNVKLVTPSGIKYQGKAKYVEYDTVDGGMGVLQNRLPIVAKLKLAPLKIVEENDNEVYYAVLGGLVDMDGDNLTIISTDAEKPEDIDVDNAMKAVKQAEERLKNEDDKIQRTKIKAYIEKNMTKVNIAKKTK
ncbi:ATP synthase F1 subunit epsilon [Geotoga petraea]|jgi:F-type H+-transporting ATPase subunit epsilon|uniref:ATP synthase epsilon chain n=1 Tax=Geotoga petraea TaxID=28234 RepID=A0A1G6N0P9_9BACT|nr:ATP synthase F1 subunit epsilon [Geotoga petraea]MDK2945923.1 F-type H+-transporting ATPase subunit epsilon [Geotoga sp.]TGG87279.1 ATP synthase F1 subunit epsilon [Geotoga petraea]SDC61271.1 ATP synthase F1 subcomplex epsilon subunit [Geotoga petraea]